MSQQFVEKWIPEALWYGTLFNRNIQGRTVQVLWHPVLRRGRGWYPKNSRWWPIFHWWQLGPFELRIFTVKAMEGIEKNRHKFHIR